MSTLETEQSDEANALMIAMGDGRVIEYDAENGRAVIEYTARPEFCHSGGIVQGGYVTGWIDSAMARAAIASKNAEMNMATLEIKISFLRAATQKNKYRAEGWVVRSGKSVMFMEGRLTDLEGKLIATGTATGQWTPFR